MSKTKTIIRVDKVKGYSVIDNTPANDDRISYGAKGVMYKALTKPDDWKFYITDFANHSPDGVTKVTSYFKELRQAGYIEYKKIRNELGQILDSEYIFHEKPLHTNEFRKPKKVSSNLIKGFHRNSENTIHGEPNTRETQDLENRILLNTDIKLNTDINQTLITEQVCETPQEEEKEFQHIESLTEQLQRLCKEKGISYTDKKRDDQFWQGKISLEMSKTNEQIIEHANKFFYLHQNLKEFRPEFLDAPFGYELLYKKWDIIATKHLKSKPLPKPVLVKKSPVIESEQSTEDFMRDLEWMKHAS